MQDAIANVGKVDTKAGHVSLESARPSCSPADWKLSVWLLDFGIASYSSLFFSRGSTEGINRPGAKTREDALEPRPNRWSLKEERRCYQSESFFGSSRELLLSCSSCAQETERVARMTAENRRQANVDGRGRGRGSAAGFALVPGGNTISVLAEQYIVRYNVMISC